MRTFKPNLALASLAKSSSALAVANVSESALVCDGLDKRTTTCGAGGGAESGLSCD